MTAGSTRAPLDSKLLRDAVLEMAGPWRRVDVVEETGSTNADLIARAAAGEDIDGAVLLAEYQTAGRGRHGRSWTAPPRSQIALSVGVRVADVPTLSWGWLPLTTGIAVVEAVHSTGITAGLKWPNDVLADQKKLAGILAEVAAPESVVVIGLGLNVDLTESELPVPEATSLTLLGASDLDRTGLTAKILKSLGTRIDSWRGAIGSDPTLRQDYQQHSLTLGTRVLARLPGDHQVTGTALAIDDFGRLCIDAGSETVTVAAGDIVHLRPADA
jgi:BirA family biotin operon repressor/biotin-[acetyl-CoA-carboxylase] ligase